MTTLSLRAELTAHLAERGLLAGDASPVSIRPLTGGVSNDVLAVTGGDFDAVVKRALGQLRTAKLWNADTTRLLTEGRALLAAAAVDPTRVPRVLDLTPEFLVIERAPSTWTTWKERLLDHDVDPMIAGKLGEFLGALQRDTAAGAVDTAQFEGVRAFEQLRVDPFHREVAATHPELRAVVEQTIDTMFANRVCLVHGDYTPKNVMVGDSVDDVWVIDWEVAHVGDPTFDPAWVIGHLLLKSIHRPPSAAAYLAAAHAFLDSRTGIIGAPVLDHVQLTRQIGCLLVARIDGRSPIDYLDPRDRDQARKLGRHVLLNTPDRIDSIWENLHD
ncbi:phosphotransferase family protein [Gordonia insulae]|uniref:Methylthioribose kinase n=1 Tax=Gordonia insulae TaxID=2420509 RepID=A0A3G8JP38_9ACTN|nr:aminoglycoside phosphotransferase family protein [Gordonia insulae]AZG46229.1 Methylthioribose kinase [Gordonia insulae]